MPILAVAALAIGFAFDASAADATFGAMSPLLSPCHLPDVPAESRCGTIDVPENPAQPDGREIPIHVAVLPARHPPARRDPVLLFSGGPGEGAVALAADTGGASALFDDRDVLMIDQRGTGDSARLSCPMFLADDPSASLADLFPLAAIDRCLPALKAKADLTQYSYLRFADDVEHVRLALGYGPVNLIGLSYGTRASQIYLRAYPKSVRTAYLGSVVPVDIATPLPFARAAQDVLDATLTACEHDAACSAAFPHIRIETKTTFDRLRDGVRVKAPDGKDVTLTAGRVGERMRGMLYRPDGAAALPYAIHRAVGGDWTPFTDGILASARDADADIAWGLFFSITCNEDVAFIREADIAPAVAGTYIGDYRVRRQQAACAKWPTYSLPAHFRDALKSDVPVMIVSGDLDPATPLSFTAHLAPSFANRVEIVLHGQGHTGWSDCVASAYKRFVEQGTARGIPSECPATPRPAFRTQ
jgi:pimeloyl-ACP methyl ester carboxylesterase